MLLSEQPKIKTPKPVLLHTQKGSRTQNTHGQACKKKRVGFIAANQSLKSRKQATKGRKRKVPRKKQTKEK